VKKETFIARIKALAKFNETTKGVLETCVIHRAEDSIPLLKAAIMGDPHAAAIVEACGRWMRDCVETTPPPRCLCCPVEFTGDVLPVTSVVTMPYAQVDAAIVSGACDGCSAKGDEFLLARAEDYLRVIYPSAHPVATGGVQ
jgi:hypothetical protein